jgi:hypothetical protein
MLANAAPLSAHGIDYTDDLHRRLESIPWAEGKSRVRIVISARDPARDPARTGFGKPVRPRQNGR